MSIVDPVTAALAAVESAMRQEYDEAKRFAPERVQQESRFVYFLRSENGDWSKAALRLCRYWKYRKLMFGSKRWLLPLNQTGRGALDHNDIEILRSGMSAFLPSTRRNHAATTQNLFATNNDGTNDTHNQPVPLLLVDLSRLPFPAGFSGTKCVFYLCAVFPEAFCHPDGVSVLYVVTSARRNQLGLHKELVSFILQGLPIRFKNIFVAQSYEEGKERLVDFHAFQQVRTLEFKTGFPPPHLASDSVNGTLKLVCETVRTDREYLPRSLGGTFDYSQFDDWVRTRISIEDCMGAAPPTINNFPPIGSLRGTNFSMLRLPPSEPIYHSEAAILTTPTGTMQHEAPPTLQYGPDTASVPCVGGKRPEKRPNTSTSTASKPRHTYQRQNRAILSLSEEKDHYTRINENLRRDNRRLESLLAQARLIASLHLT
uniref:Uncharacterized protein n=1 Tax=Amphora coffeiformis TaxID=265554 RepID=A0A7S3L4V3_9STRA